MLLSMGLLYFMYISTKFPRYPCATADWCACNGNLDVCLENGAKGAAPVEVFDTTLLAVTGIVVLFFVAVFALSHRPKPKIKITFSESISCAMDNIKL